MDSFDCGSLGGHMAFWIFKCNPDKYRLADRLADPNPTLTWTVSRFRDEISAGDTVFLWVTGSQRGIRAVLRVDEPPRLMVEMESEQEYWADRDTQEQFRVVGTLIHREVNLPHTELREIEGLADLSVFTGFQQATNFPVTPTQGEILSRLVASSPIAVPAAAVDLAS
jgi:predicted RNA-binding protein with PUA-like domain